MPWHHCHWSTEYNCLESCWIFWFLPYGDCGCVGLGLQQQGQDIAK